MIRRGRREGWLKYPIGRLEPWAKLSGITMDNVRIGTRPGFESRGSAIIATQRHDGQRHGPLMTVPRDQRVSLDTVQAYARRCKPLGDVLSAMGSFSLVGAPCKSFSDQISVALTKDRRQGVQSFFICSLLLPSMMCPVIHLGQVSIR